MIADTFKEDMSRMSAIINQTNAISRMITKISSDMNISSVLSTLSEKSIRYDEMEWNEMFHFRKNVLETTDVVGILMAAMRSSEAISYKTGEEIHKPCILFNDSLGKQALSAIGKLPLLRALSKKIASLIAHHLCSVNSRRAPR